MSMSLKNKMLVFFLAGAVALASCASSKSGYSGYQPKYKKPNPNKPLPCPMKDC